MGLIIRDYMDGMEKVIKNNLDTFSGVMRSYVKKRQSDYSWDEQIVNNIKVKKAHLFRLKLDKNGENSLTPEQDELIEYIESKNWPYTRWDSAIELEIYTRDIANKELGK